MTDENWKFSQCFGDKGDIENITEADIISTVEFDHTGDYLATGDKGGRVVLFERNQAKKNPSCEYKFYAEFQSHDAEFDYLKSLEIEEKINQIKWLRSPNNSLSLLLTNDKTIKLWKVFEHEVKLVAENNLSTSGASIGTPLALSELRLPKLQSQDKIVSALPKRIYSNAHAYHVNSISVNSDQETYLLADDLRVNLWNLNIADQSFNIVDIKPGNMEELTEVITCAEFHPQHCHLFMYSSSKGNIKLNDMRSNSLCDSHAKVFEEYLDPGSHNFFTEITSSISDVKFSGNGRYIVSRDYMTVKIWDMAMESEPIKTINVHEQLRDRLCDTYENDAIFDKFEVEFLGDNSLVMTGSYNNNFMIYPNAVNASDHNTLAAEEKNKNQFALLNASALSKTRSEKQSRNTPSRNTANEDDEDDDDDDDISDQDDNLDGSPPATDARYPRSPSAPYDDDDQEEIILQADKLAFKSKKAGHTPMRHHMRSGVATPPGGDDIDFKKSILHLSWHPRENSVAIAATNNLYIFSTL